jgi:large subunit ribosomal protein L21
VYAIVTSGGKQYRVSRGDRILVDRLEAEKGQELTLDQVLLVGSTKGTLVGTPAVDGVSVRALVVDHPRGDKVIVFKYKPKKRTRVKHGARRDLTLLRIEEIAGSAQLDDDAELAQARQDAATAAAIRPVRERKPKAPRPRRAAPAPEEDPEEEPAASAVEASAAGPAVDAEITDEAEPAAHSGPEPQAGDEPAAEDVGAPEGPAEPEEQN